MGKALHVYVQTFGLLNDEAIHNKIQGTIDEVEGQGWDLYSMEGRIFGGCTIGQNMIFKKKAQEGGES